MSDSTINYIVSTGTAAEMAAFTPSPATAANAPPSQGNVFFNTTDSILYAWSGAAWVPASGSSGVGNVTAAGTLTNNALVIGQGTKAVAVTTTGTGILTALGTNVGSAGAPVVQNGALGTPSSGTLTSATGLPLSTGVTGDLPYANLVPATGASLLLGRGSAGGAGDWQEITVSTGLTMTGTTLTASGGGGGTVTTTGSPANGNLAKFTGATSVSNTDLTGDVTTSGGVATTLKTAAKTKAITCVFDNGTSAIANTMKKVYIYVPYTCTITAVTMLADAAGATVLGIKKCAYGSFPGSLTSIVSAAPPTISATNQNSQDTTLTGWTTSITAGDVLEFSVTSGTTITSLFTALTVTV